MLSEHCWVPNCEYFDGYDSWQEYESILYEIFKTDFIESHPQYDGQQVNIRKYPIEYGKEEAFFHVTCQDYLKDGKRAPDLRRCERIRWVRAFIENSRSDSTLCDECEGIKIWKKPYKSNFRVHILLEEERYMVVLEPRNSYCLLITAFYIEHDHSLHKKVKEYESYKSRT